MKNVTQNFINDIKTYGRQLDFNVTINNESISNDNINYIKPAFYTSNENNKTALFTTIMQQLKIDTKNELAINSKIEIEAGIKVNESNYQYISYNPYTVSSCEKQEDTNSYVSLAYDKMIESMIDYDLELSEKITVRNYLILICNRLGWSTEHIPSTFINHNKLVDPALHQGINYTFRMALDEIATITCSFLLFKGEDFYLIYPTETNQIIDSSFLDEDNVNMGERYFINSLVFSRAEGSDNIYRKDNESIENNGLHEFKISNNQLLSTNDRDIYIDQMFNYLKTFEFYTFDVQSKGILFLEACDRFTFNLSGNTYSTILLNNEQEFEDGLIEKLYVDRPEETETEYKYADETDKRINQTYLIVDKQNQKIESLVQETSENTQNISRHEQTINGITNTVSSVQTKLNNMQIGGTNLLRGTNTETSLSSVGTWSRGTWRQAGTGTGTRTSISVTDAPNANIKIGWSTASTSGQVLICQDNVPTTAGEIYTISCYAKGTGKITLQYGNETLNYITSMQTITDENNWKKYSYTFTSRGTANAYFGSGNTNNNVSFCGLKIEKGNIATDWSPAPEDIESNLTTNYYTKTETESKIDQKADEITSTVTSIETKVNNLQIGARNLALNTRKFFNAGRSGTIGNGLEGTPELLEDTFTPSGYCAKYQYKQSSGNAGIYLMKGLILGTNAQKMKADEIYTLSFYAKASTSISFSSAGIFAEGQTIITPANLNLTTEWKRFYTTFKWTNTTKLTTCFYIPQGDVTLYLSSFKLEEGNIPTDWVPAPEDIESNLESNYYTKTETESKIDQRADSITSTVTSLQTQVNNIQIGGTNILRGTDIVTALTSSGTWANGTWRSATSGNGTRERIDIIDSPNGNIKKGWRFTRTAESNNGSTDIAQDYVPVANGQTYTMSCWARCVSGNVRLRLQYGKNPWRNNSHPNITDTNWKRYSYTFTVGEQSDGSTNGNTMVYFGLFPYSDNSAGVLEICGLKLESGNKATDWSPAPEDIASNYYTKTETESKIQQKADSITSTVSQNYSTKAETTQAKNEAINSANTSTDNKLANYSTTTQMNSAIIQKANEITTTVTTLENKVNNMQIGARNLAIKGCFSRYGTATYTTIDLTNFIKSGNAIISRTATSNEGPIIDRYTKFETGQEYVISFRLRKLEGTFSNFYIYNDVSKHTNTKVYIDGEYKDTFSKTINITDDTNWHRYELYFTGKDNSSTMNDNSTNHIIFQPMKSTATAYKLEIDGYKIEKGNKPTDWTPAPEDIDNNLENNYYTKTQTESKIDQKADEITSTVNVVENKIDNLQVGGRNFVLNSAFQKGKITRENEKAGWIFTNINELNTVVKHNGHNSISCIRTNQSSDAWKETTYFYYRDLTQVNNSSEKWTLSFWLYSDDVTWTEDTTNNQFVVVVRIFNGTSQVTYINLPKISDVLKENSGKWIKYVATFDINVDYTYFKFILSPKRNCNCYYTDFKLEKGNVATDWTPAPEDIESNLEDNYYTKTETESKITQKANEINIEVAKKVGNDEVISKINQSAEAVQINANKISLVGKQINLTGDNTTITSNNFSVDANGNMSCSNANITGGEINLSSTEAMPKIKIINPNDASSYGELFATGLKFYRGNQLNLVLSSLVPFLELSNDEFGHITLFPGALIISDENHNELITMNTSDNNGNITCVSLTQTSLESQKKNFEKLENTLDIIKNVDIYKYNLKNEREGTKKHIGFVIGESFKYAHEITAENKDGEEIGVDTYSMVSVLWRAVQEQQEIIEDLKSRIEKLEKKVNK